MALSSFSADVEPMPAEDFIMVVIGETSSASSGAAATTCSLKPAVGGTFRQLLPDVWRLPFMSLIGLEGIALGLDGIAAAARL